jgi:hypothetical protein
MSPENQGVFQLLKEVTFRGILVFLIDYRLLINRTFSAPMSPVSSGTLPSQISTINDLSAATTGQTMHIKVSKENVGANRIIIAL